MNPIQLAIIDQMIEETTEAEADLRRHIKKINPDAGTCPQMRADAEEWLCLVEVGSSDAD